MENQPLQSVYLLKMRIFRRQVNFFEGNLDFCSLNPKTRDCFVSLNPKLSSICPISTSMGNFGVMHIYIYTYIYTGNLIYLSCQEALSRKAPTQKPPIAVDSKPSGASGRPRSSAAATSWNGDLGPKRTCHGATWCDMSWDVFWGVFLRGVRFHQELWHPHGWLTKNRGRLRACETSLVEGSPPSLLVVSQCTSDLWHPIAPEKDR